MIEEEVHKAGAVLQSGGIILYPTDTIWGIGCDAGRKESVQNIYRIRSTWQLSRSLSLRLIYQMIDNKESPGLINPLFYFCFQKQQS